MIWILARQALRSLARHPLRTTLTLLGFAIGVGAFVAMVSFAGGARRAVVAQFESLGRGTLTITAGGVNAGAGTTAGRLFTAADARQLATDVDAVIAAAPLGRLVLPVANEGRRTSTVVVGTTPELVQIRNWSFEAGGMFDADDLALGARVCVLGRTVVDRLSTTGSAAMIGARIRVGEVDCRVVGALTPLGQTAGGQDQDDTVLVPLTLFERRLAARPGAERLIVGLAPDIDLAVGRAAVVDALRTRRRLGPGEPDDFTVKSADDLTRIADRTAALLQGLLGAIAAVSLLVGGIGIMNILLVSVGERTREIGVRAAVGATPGQVLAQFLVEAIVLAGLGAFAGAGIGGTLAAVVGARMGWGGGVPFDLIGLAVLGGIALGILFGLYPARRAAWLDPVVALRGE